MRENMGLFRGKRICNGKWMEGYLLRLADGTCLICQAGYRINRYKVDPDTVGECTGLRDKNGKLIFEGDRVVYPDSTSYSSYDDYNEGVVAYDEEAMRFYFTDRWVVEMEDFDVVDGIMVDVEIIGNVHDNPELKGGEGDGGRISITQRQ